MVGTNTTWKVLMARPCTQQRGYRVEGGEKADKLRGRVRERNSKYSDALVVLWVFCIGFLNNGVRVAGTAQEARYCAASCKFDAVRFLGSMPR